MSIPKMHLLLKPQTSILSGSPGLILQKILEYFAENQQPVIPLIPAQGFTYSVPINKYIHVYRDYNKRADKLSNLGLFNIE